MLLIKLAENLGHAEMVKNFQLALEHEEAHLVNVRNWLTERVPTVIVREFGGEYCLQTTASLLCP